MLQQAAVAPDGGGRARGRLHLVHGAAGDERRRAAVHARAVARAPPRLAEAVEAPRRPAGRRPAERGRARARRGVPGALRRADLLGVVLPQADRGVARGPRDLRRVRRLHRGDRLDRLVSDRRRVPAELHRRLQGDVVAGRGTAAGRVLRGRLSRASTARREARDRFARSAPRRARCGPRWRRRLGLPESVAVAVGNVDSFVSVPGAGVRGPGHVRHRHRHLDLRHGRRPRGDPAARDHRRGQGRDPARACTATRPARRRSATCSPGSSTAWSRTRRATSELERRRRGSPRARPGWSRSTGGTATARSSPTPTSPGRSSGSRCTPRARRSTGRCWSRSRSATAGSWTTSTSTGSR